MIASNRQQQKTPAPAKCKAAAHYLRSAQLQQPSETITPAAPPALRNRHKANNRRPAKNRLYPKSKIAPATPSAHQAVKSAVQPALQPAARPPRCSQSAGRNPPKATPSIANTFSSHYHLSILYICLYFNKFTDKKQLPPNNSPF